MGRWSPWWGRNHRQNKVHARNHPKVERRREGKGFGSFPTLILHHRPPLLKPTRKWAREPGKLFSRSGPALQSRAEEQGLGFGASRERTNAREYPTAGIALSSWRVVHFK